MDDFRLLEVSEKYVKLRSKFSNCSIKKLKHDSSFSRILLQVPKGR